MSGWTIGALMLVAYGYGAFHGAKDEDEAKGAACVAFVVAILIITVRATLFFAQI